MKLIFGLTFCLSLLFLGTLSSPAWAGDGQAGSCLIYPYFNNQQNEFTIIRITNVSMKDVYVRLVFIDEVTCSPEDRWFTLTGGDNFTFTDAWMNPNPARGFLYAHVVESASTPEEDMNVLIGQEFIYGSSGPQQPMRFSVNAMAYRALNVVPDNKIHLDEVEYEAAPKTVYFPGFFGQHFPNAQNPFVESKVILINLTGGKFFRHTANLLVYNDNEQSFSTQHEFPCFAFVDLVTVSPATRNNFLLSTMHDPDEPSGFSNLGLETGWLSMTGNYAVNPNTSFVIANASMLAVLVEQVGPVGFVADLPFHLEDPSTHNNGMLWSTSAMGN